MSAIPPPDDPLARAEAALRRLPAPEGPAHETVARTLAALQAAGPRIIPFHRRKTMPLVLKIAAAVLVAAGGLFYFAGVLPVGTPVAFAEVARKFRDAHSLAYRVTVRSPALKEPLTMRLLFREPGLMRTEGPGNRATITDLTKDRTLILFPQARTALLLQGKKPDGQAQPAADSAVQTVEQLRQLAAKEGKPVGKRRIGDVESLGFRVKDDGHELTLWADPKTRLPLLVESTVRVGDQEAHVTLSDFELDPKLDTALFHLEPPAGYKVQTVATEEETDEDAVVRMLGAYAQKSGGKFPARLDDWGAIMKEMLREEKKTGPLLDPELIRFMESVGQITAFRYAVQGGYHYKPDGAKLGDAGTILFWYRPEGAAKYRALDANLRWADVTPDQLPQIPKP